MPNEEISISFAEEEVSQSYSQTVLPEEEQSNGWSKEIFQEMDLYFDAKMIIEKTEEGFVPKFWSGPWTILDKNRCPFVNTKDPNIFRIAHNSQRPFHGPASPNKVNDQLFEFWNGASYPEEITIHPIQNGPDILGMVVGIPKDTNDSHKKLQLVFNLSQKAQEQLTKAA